jgi:hypothetical protein
MIAHANETAGYAFLSTLRFLARPCDEICLLAVQSQSRLAGAPSNSKPFDDQQLDPYREVRNRVGG